MDRNQCYNMIGKPVRFGRTYGEQTLGTIVKVNPSRCKVRQDEERGGRRIGTLWNVPFALIHPADGSALPAPAAPKVEPFVVNDYWVRQNGHALHILDGIYAGLSPENLTCDGEASRSSIIARSAQLHREMKAVFVLLGRDLSEEDCFAACTRLEELEKQDQIAGICSPG